jgi:hypothetical protein
LANVDVRAIALRQTVRGASLYKPVLVDYPQIEVFVISAHFDLNRYSRDGSASDQSSVTQHLDNTSPWC